MDRYVYLYRKKGLDRFLQAFAEDNYGCDLTDDTIARISKGQDCLTPKQEKHILRTRLNSDITNEEEWSLVEHLTDCRRCFSHLRNRRRRLVAGELSTRYEHMENVERGDDPIQIDGPIVWRTFDDE